MDIPTIDDIVARATTQLFGRSLLTNIDRAAIVEAIVAAALEPDWRWCSADYASHDFNRGDVRLEVKQSASLQSWNADTLKPSLCQFDIAPRTGEWEDAVTWKPRVGRNADIYVLCHHPIVSAEADHRDPSQWRFFAIAEASLPQQKTIALSSVEKLTAPVGWADLKTTVDALADRIPT